MLAVSPLSIGPEDISSWFARVNNGNYHVLSQNLVHDRSDGVLWVENETVRDKLTEAMNKFANAVLKPCHKSVL